MKLIKVILIIILFIIFGCNDNSLSKPNTIYVEDKNNMINSKEFDFKYNYKHHYACHYLNSYTPYSFAILDYNYYFMFNYWDGFQFYFTFNDTIGENYYDYDSDKIIYEYRDYSKGYVIDIQETSCELFAKKLEEYLNTTLYYKQDKFELKKLITIKKILKEYFYASNQQNYLGHIPLKKYHKGIKLKYELINKNSLIWKFENIYTNDKYNIELCVENNLYNIIIKNNES